jgi:hypothetical protein
VVPRTGTGYVKQVALGIVDLLEIRVIGHCFDSLLQRDYFIVAGHDSDGPEFEPFGKMHGTDRNVAACRFNVFVEHSIKDAGFLRCRAGTINLGAGTDKEADLVGRYTFQASVYEPSAHCVYFFLGIAKGHDLRFRPIEYGNGTSPVFPVAVNI